MNIMEIFRRNIRERRKELRLTQEKLADKADLSFTFISQLERGEKEPSLRTAYKISQALKTSVDILFAEKEDRNIAIKKLMNAVKDQDKDSIEMAAKVVNVMMEEKEKYIVSSKKKSKD